MLSRARVKAPAILATAGLFCFLFALVAQSRSDDGMTQPDTTAAVVLAVLGVVAIAAAALIGWLDRGRIRPE
ncbi:MAG: hypothetical protein U0W40_12900 [Acidimicrobiia bacterium]